MADFIAAIKQLGLTQFYMSLSVPHKMKLAQYSQYLIGSPEHIMNCSTGCKGCYMVSNGVEFLWATAAKAIDKKDYSFAEPVLNYALTLAEDERNLAWIHANLAQICYHQHKLEPELGKKGINHCKELIRLGYMKSWAESVMEEIMLFQV